MRAKFVNEGVHFERGLNPKEVMGIGIMRDIKRKVKALLDENFSHMNFMVIYSKGGYLFVFLDTTMWRNMKNFKKYIWNWLEDFGLAEYIEPIGEGSDPDGDSFSTSAQYVTLKYPIKPEYRDLFIGLNIREKG